MSWNDGKERKLFEKRQAILAEQYRAVSKLLHSLLQQKMQKSIFTAFQLADEFIIGKI